MALGPCPECKSRISDQATVCPHCGAPVVGRIQSPVPKPPKPKRHYGRWGFEAILIVGVATSALTIYGRWQVRRNAPRDFKCWAELYDAQREAYLSLSARHREQMNFASCPVSEAVLRDLLQFPASERDAMIDKAVDANRSATTP